MARSSIVIKVKFGDALRRFNIHIHDQELDFDMAMLREKIRNLFGITPDADFTLTYIDEDDDVVTLSEDDDLCDITAQSLDPVMITVRLNPDKLGKSHDRSNESMRSLHDQLRFKILSSGVTDILKLFPEPLQHAIWNILVDLSSKATSAKPELAELMEKMRTTHVNKVPESQTGLSLNILGGSTLANTMGASGIKVQQGLKSNGASTNSKPPTVEEHKVSLNAEVGNIHPLRSVDFNVPYYESETSRYLFNNLSDSENGAERKKDSESVGAVQQKSTGFGASDPDYLKHCLQDSGSSLCWQQGMLDAINEWPFKGMPLSSYSFGPTYPYVPPVPPFKGRYNYSNGLSNMHMGIWCNCCGVNPITGPRFKSRVKVDNNLCRNCFEQMGHDADYVKIDRSQFPLKGFGDYCVPSPGMMIPWFKLDSRFIQDVNFPGGAFMAPSITFTKTWRMRNNGKVVWPQGLQLMWIGGSRLHETGSVLVEIPADGLPVDQELDISVDFTAPKCPGRYISYWRMASPSGVVFGQHVYVLILVDASMKDMSETSFDLNLPPVGNDKKEPEAANNKIVHDNFLYETHFLLSEQHRDKEMNLTVNDTTAAPGAANPTTPTMVQVRPPGSNLDQEQTLLRKLADMGFRQVDLNKETLRKNGYDLEKSVQELCGVPEWDLVVNKLQELASLRP